MKTVVLSPAYGRDYKSKIQVESDFNDDKDFVIESFMDPWCGKVCNKSDLRKGSDYTHAEIRYKKKMSLIIVPIL